MSLTKQSQELRKKFLPLIKSDLHFYLSFEKFCVDIEYEELHAMAIKNKWSLPSNDNTQSKQSWILFWQSCSVCPERRSRKERRHGSRRG